MSTTNKNNTTDNNNESDKDKDNNGKVAFSLGGGSKSKQKKKKNNVERQTFNEFQNDDHDHDEDTSDQQWGFNNNNEPLVIPLQQNTRLALTEQKEQESKVESKIDNNTCNNNNNDNNNDDDAEAVRALEEDAAAAAGNTSSTEPNDTSGNDKTVISKQQNTFQRRGGTNSEDGVEENNEKEQFEKSLNSLATELNVDDDAYQKVPITEFGAAMLRGMGWTQTNETGHNKPKSADVSTLPRPSRLGLGATPKILTDDTIPETHSRRKPKRPDQLRQEKLRLQQQQQMQEQRKMQIAMDKQQTMQVGSIVWDETNQRRAVVRQLQGVPGLNMILVQYENSHNAEKTKKGAISLISRKELEKTPFMLPKTTTEVTEIQSYRQSQQHTDIRSQSSNHSTKSHNYHHDNDRHARKHSRRKDYYSDDSGDHKRKKRRRHDNERHHDNYSSSTDSDSSKNKSSKKHRRMEYHDDRDKVIRNDKRRSNHDLDGGRDRRRKSSERPDGSSRSRDYDKHSSDHKSHRHKRNHYSDNDEDDSINYREHRSNSKSNSSAKTWLIPNIRVRIVTESFGRTYYKQKGIVVDISPKAKATLQLDESSSGRKVLQVPERYLETALPKVGGNAIVVANDTIHKWKKGRLLERNSKTSKGVLQMFEDMNVVTLPLDDIAEWCGPLDDDLME